MNYYYHHDSRGFYCGDIHSVIPVDSVELSETEYRELIEGQAMGGRISSSVGGRPFIVPASMTILEQHIAKEHTLRAEGSLRLSALAAPYLPAERETWATQQSEARAWSLDPAASTPMLSAMALARGISLSDLAGKVLENVALFEAASGAILGQQQALLDTLAAVDPTAPDAATRIAAITWP
jgi:hypothetical protein